MFLFLVFLTCSESGGKYFNFSVEITRDNVLQYLNKKKTAIIHSYSSNCKHCTEFNPFWNELVRLYYDKDDQIVFGHVKCDLYKSVCSTYNFKTPGLTLFNDVYERGFPLIPARDLQRLTKSVIDETGIEPYTRPDCLLYVNERQLNNILSDGESIFIVISDMGENSVNQSEIRKLEYTTRLPIYAIRQGIESINELTCKGEYPCLGILEKNSFKRYTGSIEEDGIRKFISDFLDTHKTDL